ncbi:MAG: hypothetical protein EAZ97_12600 [Bacteroidetes bacterium]|nr:MAG: hypothetical protein EAZ97_12600 [Bacteroidota bacterium]
MSANPLNFKTNQVIDFQQITVENLIEQTDFAIEKIKAELEKLYHISPKTFDNTMLAYDEIINQLSSNSGVIYLLTAVSPNDEIRNTAMDCVQKFEQFGNSLLLDEQLYKAIKSYSQTPEAQNLRDWQEKLVRETVRDFEMNGFALPQEKRQELQKLQDDLSLQTQLFGKHIAEHQDFLLVSETEIDGLPEDYIEQHKSEEGYKITLDYPSYVPFMQYSKSESARKALYIKYLNKAADKNLEVLDNILALRSQISALLGFKTFAEYRMANTMAKNTATVWKFENDLKDKVRKKAELDYQEVLAVKKQFVPNATVLESWESSFYKNILLKNNYQLDQQEVKQYFELNNVLKGIFSISEKLFGIVFEEVEKPNLWHNEARLFEVKEGKKLIGRFYLDLFPRPNKFSHAACFPMIMGKQQGEIYQMPLLALVCNFPKPSLEKPSLLTHSDVETMFHEFGHGLHCLLTTSPVCVYAGTNTVRDFVEVPSQLFENWAWNYESLTLFAKHYQTNEVLPKNLFQKMLDAKNIGSGLHALQQVFYGMYDLSLHDSQKIDKSTTEILKDLQNEVSLFKHLEGTHFQAAFGHLTDYAASYYGYLWSLVYADDMFSEFEKHHILDSEIGTKYKNLVLSKGGSQDEMQQITNFLGRESNADAFLKALGL